MELSPASDPDATPRQTQRKSGRVPKPRFASSPSGATPRASKRKRTPVANGDDNEEASSELSEENEEESAEDEPDEEEILETRRKARAKATPRAKPAPKRVKTTGNSLNLPLRPAGNKARKPTTTTTSKKSRLLVNADAAEIGGLYGEVFANEDTLESVASEWLRRFRTHESNAITEIINLVLRCTGCEIEVVATDIEDPDNCTNRLKDIQDEFQANAPSDYPLNSKTRTAVEFKRSLSEFFRLLYLTISSTNTLFDEPLLNENVQVWISTLSGASSRPFRHTAAVVALTITSALCEIGKGLADKRATTLRQIEGEEKNKRPHKGRIADWKKEADTAAERLSQVEAMIQDWFDTVFVHRYRDVDPKIRLDCITHLGDWVMTFPDKFFDGQHLRYLGWVLSDSAAGTRVESLKQLQKFFKDNSKIGGLRQFTERFRPRIVEIAGRDNEVNARMAALELLNTLRAKGLLEPNDIDTIGKLIFDSEARVRRVVVDFFAASVEDSFEGKIEDLGGIEALDEALPIEADDDFSSPRLSWLRIKCLAELLQSYDSDDNTDTTAAHRVGDLHDIYSADNIESRLSLAAQSLIEKIPDLKQWDVLAGYLLFDHSALPGEVESEDLSVKIQQAYKLGDKEEIILLDVLNASVKASLAEVAENATCKVKKTKAQLRELHEQQEDAAQRLAATIPKLLKKFGASPESALTVLRLERVLNLDIFEQLRQDSTTYSTLLDDINKQFLTHENQSVLAEARTALLHAKSFEELEEITGAKLAALWDDTTHALTTLCRGEDMSARGTIHESALAILASTVLRISNLASISDCTEQLETERRPSSDQPRRKQGVNTEPVTPIDALIATVGRGVPVSGMDAARSVKEDLLTTKACESVTFYFLWRVRNMQSDEAATINSTDLTTLRERKEAFVSHLLDVIKRRRGADELRLTATGALLELHVLFATLRGIEGSEELITPLEATAQERVLRVFVAAEKDFAKRTGKALLSSDADNNEEEEDEEEDDADPTQGTRDRTSMSPASSVASDDGGKAEGEEGDDSAAQRKQRAALLSEHRLCDLAAKCVLAIVAGVVDATSDNDGVTSSSNKARKSKKSKKSDGAGKMTKRLTRNAAKLGANFKTVVGALQTGGAVGKKGKTRAKAAPAGGKAAKSKETVVSDDEEEEDGEAEDPIEDDEAGDERRAAVGEDDAHSMPRGSSAAPRDEDSIMGD